MARQRKPRIWRAIEVVVRDADNGDVRRYIIETKAGWKFAEKKALVYAKEEGMTSPHDVESSWLSCPFFRGR